MKESELSAKCCCKPQQAVTDACCQRDPCGEQEQSCRASWITGTVASAIGPVPRIGTQLRLADHLGTCMVRWAIGRMSYCVPPGLYAVGTPGSDSPVLVSANYKLSFDRLRSNLGGLDAWILVLDTRGVNVWCAAGKGTFGTDELVCRIEAARLAEVVTHRTLVVPQLGAAGVAAHEVKKRSGFRVVYGPVRAEDLPAFLAAGMTATPSMRQVQFPLRDRLVLAPVEVLLSMKWACWTMAIFFILAGLGADGYSISRTLYVGACSAALLPRNVPGQHRVDRRTAPLASGAGICSQGNVDRFGIRPGNDWFLGPVSGFPGRLARVGRLVLVHSCPWPASWP